MNKIIVPCLLRVGGVAGAFNDIGTVSGIYLQLGTNRVISLYKRGKSNGSALVGILYNVCPRNSCRNRVVFTKRRVRTDRVHSARHGNVTVVRRRLTLIGRLAILRGVFLNGRVARGNVVSCSLVALHYRGLLTRIDLSVSPSAHINSLKLKRRRLIRVTGTLGGRIHLLVLSRPATSLARRRASILLSVVHSLRRRNVTYVCVSRGLGRIGTVSSAVYIVHSKRRVNAHSTTKVDRSSVVAVVIKQRLATLCPGRPRAAKSRVLHVRRLAT